MPLQGLGPILWLYALLIILLTMLLAWRSLQLRRCSNHLVIVSCIALGVKTTLWLIPIDIRLLRKHYTHVRSFLSRDSSRWSTLHVVAWHYVLYFHHRVKLLSSLLKLFFIWGMIVGVWTYSAHGVSTGLVADCVPSASYNASLVLNLYVNWLSVMPRSARNRPLRSRTSCVSINSYISSRLYNLLVLWIIDSSAAIHGIIHHAALI